METILTFLAGWLSTLSGVALGGWLVYRTKRESYDPLIGPSPKGEAFNLQDMFEGSDEPVRTSAKIPETVQQNHDKFAEQFAEQLAKRAGRL